MAFKFSQKQKDTMDFIRAYGSFFTVITIVVALCFAFDVKDINFKDMPPYQMILLRCAGCLIILVPFIVYYWERIRLAYTLRKNNLSRFIIEKQKTILDIHDAEGKKATFFQKIYFHEFNKKTKSEYIAKMHVSGVIDPSSIQTLNCNYSFMNHERSSLKVTYINNTEKHNKTKNFFKQNDKFLFFYAELKDSFLSKEESWGIDVVNLCQDYTLQVIFPAGKKVEKLRFVKVLAENTEIKVDDIQPIIVRESTRDKVILQVMNFDKEDHYKLIWSLSS
jgi:hypothetical protein